MGPDAMILVFWMLSFKPTFSLSSFTFITQQGSHHKLKGGFPYFLQFRSEFDNKEFMIWATGMTVKEESEKVGLKLNIQKMKIMVSGPITHGK